MVAVRIWIRAYQYHQRNNGIRVITPGFWRRKRAWERKQAEEKAAKEAEYARYRQIIVEREQWIAKRREEQRKNLAVLNLPEFPTSLAELKAARKSAMFIAHPDRGGTEQDTVRVTNAYEELMRYLGLDKLKKAA